MTRHRFGTLAIGAAALLAGAVPAGAEPEPDAAAACQWWPDLKDIWTPVGWKNHLFRYNIFYNGIIDAHPDLNARTQAWKGQGVQLYPAFTTKGNWAPNTDRDDGAVVQGWEEGAAPVLWSEWSHDGFLVRQSVFAHVPGARPVETGTEPLFLWVRVSVHDVCAALPLEPKAGLAYKINAPHLSGGMTLMGNVWFNLAASAYPRKLAPDADGPVASDGWRLVEEDGRVRLGVAPPREGRSPVALTYAAGKPQPGDAVLAVLLEGKKGAFADLLVPMLPIDRATFDRELALGYDAARAGGDVQPVCRRGVPGDLHLLRDAGRGHRKPVRGAAGRVSRPACRGGRPDRAGDAAPAAAGADGVAVEGARDAVRADADGARAGDDPVSFAGGREGAGRDVEAGVPGRGAAGGAARPADAPSRPPHAQRRAGGV
jgi:hypothetical protein